MEQYDSKPREGEQESSPTDERTEKLARTVAQLQIEALAVSAGATDAKAVMEIAVKNAKAELDASGTVKISMINPATGEKLRNANGTEITVGQFIAQMKADPDHGYLFKGGAAGKPKPKATDRLEMETNPWHRDTFNLTEQARLLKTDPNAARIYQAAARGTLPDNPWSKEGFNLTRQSLILRDDPALAARMKAEVAPKENPWLKEQENLTKQVLMIRSDPERARRLKAEAAASNGPAPKKSYIFIPPPNAFRRRA